MSSTTQDDELIDTTSEGTGRIEAFSDGVIAIAITLLVLEIKVPPIHEKGLVDDLLKLWPSYGGFLTSFLVIGIIWLNHHQMYKLIKRTDRIFLVLNLLLLLVVSFIPFPTAVLAESLREGHEQQVATILYSGVMLVMALSYNILWRYAAANRRLLDQRLSSASIKTITTRYNFGCLLYVLAFGLAFISYEASLILIVILAIYFLLPSVETLIGRKQA